jgi:hypothetical protein
MHRWAAVSLLLIACVLVSGSADAKPAPKDFRSALKALNAAIIVPPEWDGVWDTVDSSYDCKGVLTGTSASEDTICGGQAVTSGDPNSPFTFTCTGTANGNTIDVTCTGGGQVLPECQLSIDFHIQVTRTGDSFRSVTTSNSTYSGTGCMGIPDVCSRDVQVGSRSGPAPVDFCTTSVRRATWGQLKTIYR